MLAALAGVVEAQASAAGPGNPQAPTVLQKAVALLLDEVEGDTAIPPPTRDQVLADLRHVLWLLDHVNTYGVDYAVAAVEKVAGRAAAAAATTGSDRLRKVAIGLTAALVLTSTAFKSVAEIATSLRTTFGIEADANAGEGDVVQSTVVQIYNVAVPKELPSGLVINTSAGEPVDAEVVEDDDPNQAP